MKDTGTYDLLSFIAVWLGFHQGLYPFAAKAFDWRPRMALALRLPGPWWWIVSALVAVAVIAVLIALDNAKKRHRPAS
jgi:hypothetical protein